MFLLFNAMSATYYPHLVSSYYYNIQSSEIRWRFVVWPWRSAHTEAALYSTRNFHFIIAHFAHDGAKGFSLRAIRTRAIIELKLIIYIL